MSNTWVRLKFQGSHGLVLCLSVTVDQTHCTKLFCTKKRDTRCFQTGRPMNKTTLFSTFLLFFYYIPKQRSNLSILQFCLLRASQPCRCIIIIISLNTHLGTPLFWANQKQSHMRSNIRELFVFILFELSLT